MLAQLDHTTIQYLRSFEHPLLDQIGKVGNRLGDGLTLVLVSLGIGGAGLFWNSPRLKSCALFSLLAHGIAALITQIIKHSLGRPRPRHMDKGPWEIGPSFEIGYDAFPSGHASASFTVATVLAFYFPKGKYLWFGLAAFVGMCRVTKGSHFPTDVFGGMLVGIATGLALVYAKNQWEKIGAQALARGLPWVITVLGLFWVLVPQAGTELEPAMSLFIGLTLLLGGLGLRLWWIRENTNPKLQVPFEIPIWPRILMGLGLASSTGSLIIVGTSMLAGIVWWYGAESQPLFKSENSNSFLEGVNPIVTEAALGMSMFLLALLTFSIRISAL